MYLTIKQEPRLTKEELMILRQLSHTAKSLYNEALYNVRQHFFNTGNYLNYYENYKQIKDSDNYKLLNSNMSQQILKEVDGSFKSFFSLLKLKNKGKYDEKVKIPHYLDKNDYLTLIIGFVRIIDNNKLVIPYSNSFRKNNNPITVTIPPQLINSHIKEIRIIPKLNASYFEFQYTYEADVDCIKLSSHNYISLDIGINNLVTAVSSNGSSFIIDGRYLKSINQWFNKQNSKLSSIHYKQLYFKGDSSKIPYTSKQNRLIDKRNKRINDYMSKCARYIINYCLDNDIGNIVLGYNLDFQRNSKLSKQNNQSFTSIPIGKLKDKLTYLSELYGINLIIQEESYTSKASFLDNDDIPTYKSNDTDNNDNYKFSGSRIKRGLYKTSNGTLINSDINGSLNILKKALLNTSKADDCKNILNNLCIVGHVDVPVRIRLA
ncbi:MAG: transposase [Erysipelotrichaceae bacterium]|nr:transposase [Erysipelotrichaceae bacterium]